MESDLVPDVLRVIAAEDDALSLARQRAGEDAALPSVEVGSLFAWAAAATGARNVVEVGNASGVSGLWLLRGMSDRAVLTSVEADPGRQGLASQAYEAAGQADRVRAILGDPLEVLDRLSDAAYGLIVLQDERADLPAHLRHAVRLLKPGGVLIALRVLPDGGPADDAVGRFTETLADDPRLVATVLPFGGGIALATMRET